MKIINPPLKWAGGKRWIVPSIRKYYSDYSNTHRLVEPFAGGLAVALGVTPNNALLNDINPHLINFYLWLRKGLKIDGQLENDEQFFYEQREVFNASNVSSKKAAEIFYYLNRTGFNGLCRFNSKGKFNVPFGRYKTINYLYDFKDYKKVFKHWRFSCKDFESLKIEKSDFLYVDPPYDVPFTQYSKQSFSWQDQKRLVEWLVSLKNPMVVSNQATKRVLEMYKDAGFELKILDAPRRIASNGNRKNAKEVLALRNI